MKRRTSFPKKKHCCDNRCMLSVTVLRDRSSVESFYRQENENVHSSDKSVSFRTDVYMLFNQQRLDRGTLAAFSDYLNKNVQPGSALSSVRKKMSDSQLHQFVKSRYIQSLGELQAWSRYLESEFNGEVSKAQAAQKAAEEARKAAETSSASAASGASGE